MSNWKKRILSCFVIGIAWNFGMICLAEASTTEERTDQIAVLEQRIEEELEQGSSSYTIYLNKKIETSQLQEINSRLDGFYGTVDRYQQWQFPLVSYYKTTFYFDLSDNYYVLAYLNGDYTFTKKQEKCRELAQKVKEIQDNLITASMTDYEKVVAIHDYLVDTSSYEENKPDNAAADEYRAYGVLINHRGVCSSYTQAFQLFMELNGIESKIVLGQADGVSHSWNMVCLDGQWYHVDTTWDDPVPDEDGRRLYAYLNVTDAFLEESHTWDTENYPSATATKYNYYVQNDSVIQSKKEFITYVQERLKKKEGSITCLVQNYEEKEYGKELFQTVMEGTGAESLNLQMYGEGEERAFLLIPEYGKETK
jgi:transglutaminase/protease-like cytokinesis protein 3